MKEDGKAVTINYDDVVLSIVLGKVNYIEIINEILFPQEIMILKCIFS